MMITPRALTTLILLVLVKAIHSHRTSPLPQHQATSIKLADLCLQSPTDRQSNSQNREDQEECNSAIRFANCLWAVCALQLNRTRISPPICQPNLLAQVVHIHLKVSCPNGTEHSGQRANIPELTVELQLSESDLETLRIQKAALLHLIAILVFVIQVLACCLLSALVFGAIYLLFFYLRNSARRYFLAPIDDFVGGIPLKPLSCSNV